MKANLSLKEKRFLEKYFQGKPLYECAKYAGSKSKDKQSLSNIGYIMLKRLDISLEEIMEKAGLTDQALIETLQEGRSANKRFFGTWQGEIVESKPFPDVPVRLKAIELAARMKGHFVDRTEITGKDGGDLILQLAASKRERKAKAIKLDED